MRMRASVNKSLSLLSKSDVRKLKIAAFGQMLSSFLDLIGVLLVGVVTALSVSIVSNAPPPALIENLLNLIGFSHLEIASTAILLGALAGLTLITKSLINVYVTKRVLRFLAVRQAVVSGRLTAELLSRPLLEVQNRSSQQTAYALTNGVYYSTLVILGQTVVAVSEVTLLIVLAIGLLIVSPVVTVFAALFFICVAVILQRLLSGWAGRLGEQGAQAEVASLTSIQEALRTYREIVVSQRRGLYVERFQELRGQAAVVQSDLLFMGLVPKYVFEVALIIGAALLAFSQFYTQNVTAALSVIAIFLAAGSRIVPSMLRLQGAALAIRSASQQALPTFDLADELASTDPMPTPKNNFSSSNVTLIREMLDRGFPELRADVLVENVDLTYPGTLGKSLSGVSFQLQAGMSMALVGPTGAGKSSLADVLLGVVSPDCGTVQIDGKSPVELTGLYPGAVAYVPQDVAMVSGSVRENVALGLPIGAINDDRVWRALESADLAGFLKENRDGLETIIGEHGIKLSGGQKQRLGLARALYSGPKLLVLDEATSALDAETERSISRTLQDLEGSVTTVTIAHRLATIRHCDLILYMERGEIIASGTFDEVRSSAPNFDKQANLLGL